MFRSRWSDATGAELSNDGVGLTGCGGTGLSASGLERFGGWACEVSRPGVDGSRFARVSAGGDTGEGGLEASHGVFGFGVLLGGRGDGAESVIVRG